mgnify:CR=1 FL=1
MNFSYKDGKIKVEDIVSGSDYFRSKYYGLEKKSGEVANEKEFFINLYLN